MGPNSASTTLFQLLDFDLAVMTKMNHSIISFGSFSFWTAYLRFKGVTIWYKDQPGGIPVKHLNTVDSNWIGFPDPCSKMVDEKKVFSFEDGCVK